MDEAAAPIVGDQVSSVVNVDNAHGEQFTKIK
jgi:hypothetical protein